jgi:hypothetical protein
MCSASIRAPGAGALLAALRVCGLVEQLARERVEVPGVEWKLPEAGVVARYPSVPLRTPTGPAPGPRLSSTLPRTERAWRSWMLRKGAIGRFALRTWPDDKEVLNSRSVGAVGILPIARLKLGSRIRIRRR